MADVHITTRAALAAALTAPVGEWGMPLPDGFLADVPTSHGGRRPCRQTPADGASFCPDHLEQLRDPHQ